MAEETTEQESPEMEKILSEMRDVGINGAIVRKDGVLMHSTIALNDMGASMLASVCNVSDALVKRVNDEQKDMEIVFGDQILVLVPLGNYIFVGSIKDRENKTTVLEFAKKAEPHLA